MKSEQIVIGSIVQNPSLLDQVSLHFWMFKGRRNKRPGYGELYKLCKELWEENKQLDVILLQDKISKTKFEPAIRNELTQLLLEAIEETVSVDFLPEHQNEVLKAYLCRKTKYEIKEQWTKISPDNFQDVWAYLSDKFNELSKFVLSTNTLQRDSLEAMQLAYSGTRTIPWKHDYLNEMMNGVERKNLTFVAARPGMGKTTFIVDQIPFWCNKGYKVSFYSIEMDNAELWIMMLSSICDVSRTLYRYGKLDQKILVGIDEIRRACVEKWSKHLTLHDQISKQNQIYQSIRTERPDIVLVDYLQLVPGIDRANIRGGINEFMINLKAMSKTYNFAGIIVSQLSREIEKRIDLEKEENLPRLSDLAESGFIEQIASAILFLHNKWNFSYETPVDPADKDLTDLLIAKQRFGENSRTKIRWLRDRASFKFD